MCKSHVSNFLEENVIGFDAEELNSWGRLRVESDWKAGPLVVVSHGGYPRTQNVVR